MVAVTTFYRFTPLSPERLTVLTEALATLAQQHALHGLVLLAPEGINATLSGTDTGIAATKAYLTERVPAFADLDFKDSRATNAPFKRFKIDRRAEIVAADMPGVYPQSTQNHHLSPEAWHATLERDPDVFVIDARNDYETRIGKFKNALDPHLKTFSAFAQYIDNNPLPRDQKILMYCTGGIRCEKAILTMQERGYDNVYQLEGGILKYFEAFPDGGAYEGECFLFDHRVAVDSHLQPSQRYRLCPHCGDPSDASITCAYCGGTAVVCVSCRATESLLARACTKNCAHHLRMGTPTRV